jgi:sigma-B regulation protein RsbU (phosphoserine phosphatase)
MVMREEMRMATEIQINLLPKEQPSIPGYDIAGKTIPAKEVGGDYYDFIQSVGNQNRFAFCLGDVTGKGLPAAMLMSNIQATIRNQTLVENPPKDCMKHANTLMFQSTGLGKFITLFYGILDAQQHTLTYSNAGHDSPFLFSNNSDAVRLETGGVVLGFVPQYSFAEETVAIQLGNRIVLYSDGITEARNELEEEFGEERLQQVITENRVLSSGELIDKIVASVKEYAGNTPQGDDMTIVVVTRKR